MIARSPTLTMITAFVCVTWLAWFITEVIIHSESDQQFDNSNDPYTVVGPLSAQSLQLYMYATLLAVFSLMATWYSAGQRTRAARTMGLFVSIFTLFAWFWELYFIIPSLKSHSDPGNWYCNGYVDTSVTNGVGFANPDSRYCRLAEAVASLSIIMGFALALNCLYGIMNWLAGIKPEIPVPTRTTLLAPTNANVNAVDSAAYDDWRVELTEPDDLELMKIAINKPNVYESIRDRMNIFSFGTWGFTVLTLGGWVILTCASVQLSRDIGLYSYINAFNNQYRWGDPIIATLWFPLTVTLGVSMAASSYSTFRYNRGITSTAMMLAWVTALQWASFFIYSCRRLDQANSDSTLSSLIHKDAQIAMVSGAGIIMGSELLKAIWLTVRYSIYMPITKLEHDQIHIPSHVDAPTVIIADKDDYKNGVHTAGFEQAVNVPGPAAHQVDAAGVPTANAEVGDDTMWCPSYNLGMFAGSSNLFRVLFWIQVLVISGFFLTEFVTSCNSNLFTGTGAASQTNGNQNTTIDYSPEQTFYFDQILFIYSITLLWVAWMASFRAERESSVASSVANFFITTIAVAGWFLLIWPTAYQALPNVGSVDDAASNQAKASYYQASRAASIFSFLELFCLGCLWLNSLFRLAERQRLNVMEKGTMHVPSSVGTFMVLGLMIWALATIDIGLDNDDFLAQSQSQLPGQLGASVWETYWASQVFLILVSTALAGWIASYATKSLYAWQSWQYRGSALMTTMLNLSILTIFIILTCRFINNNSLGSAHTAQAAGILIMWIGSLFYATSTLYLVHEAFYTVGAAGAAIPPQGTQMVANVGPYATDKNGQFVPTKYDPAANVTAVPGPVVTEANTYPTTYPNAPVTTNPNPVVVDRNTGETYPVVQQNVA